MITKGREQATLVNEPTKVQRNTTQQRNGKTTISNNVENTMLHERNQDGKLAAHYMIPSMKILENLGNKDRNQISSHLGLGVRAGDLLQTGRRESLGAMEIVYIIIVMMLT